MLRPKAELQVHLLHTELVRLFLILSAALRFPLEYHCEAAQWKHLQKKHTGNSFVCWIGTKLHQGFRRKVTEAAMQHRVLFTCSRHQQESGTQAATSKQFRNKIFVASLREWSSWHEVCAFTRNPQRELGEHRKLLLFPKTRNYLLLTRSSQSKIPRTQLLFLTRLHY